MTITEVPEWNAIFNLLLDPAVSEIEANGPDNFFMKRAGQRIKIENISLPSEEAYINGIEKGLVPFVRSMNAFDRHGYLFEGRLNFSSNGTDVSGRCHIVLPPTCDYAQVTIAKKTASLKTIDSIAAMGSMSTEMMDFLNMAVKANLTIVFSGGTGAGKDIYAKTLISTPFGMKKAEDISVGDTIFDENGIKTKVLTKYSPEENNFYELTFNNGEKVKAGGGHVWKVLDLNKKKEFGHKTQPIFTQSELSRVMSALELDDNMITIQELTNIIEGNDLDAPVKRKNISEQIRNEIKGFGITGGELLSFDRNDLIAKVSSIKSEQSKRVTSELNKINTPAISLKKFKSLVGNRSFSYSVLGNISSSENKVFYNKNEILSYLIKRHNERLDSRAALDQSKINQARPTILITTDEIFERQVKNNKGRTNFAIEKISNPIDYDEQDLIIDPYTLGAWLGDGFSDRGNICGVYSQVVEKIDLNYKIANENKNIQTGNITYSWNINGLRSQLKDLGLINNKHIPNEYKTSSVEQRKELLAGLMDTDGSFDYRRGYPIIEMTNENIVHGAREIVASLGWKVSKITSKSGSYMDKNRDKIVCKDVYMFAFYPDSMLDLQVPHKRETLKSYLNAKKTQFDRHNRHYIVDIKKIDGNSKEYFCFGVDSPDHTYLVGESFIPTHNTTMLEALAKNIPSSLRIGVAEDTPELVLSQPNVSYLHSVPWQPGMDSNEVATLSWVVQQFQRMRTDKLIIGETRGKEFADFLIAANSGMEGSMTTIHADDPTRCLMKMTNFAMKGSERQPVRAINNDIANAVDIIVQLVIVNGKHRVSHIQEIVPTLGNTEEAKITTAPLYRWDRSKDMFYKDNVMTDNLRERIVNNGVNIDQFLASTREVRQPAHGASKNLPTNTQGRTLPRSLPTSPIPGKRSL